MNGIAHQNNQERIHALDAVRGFALLLGIVLHTTMSFQSGLVGAGWPIVDNDPSAFLGLTFYVIHVFRMSTFFFIAGFFAHVVYHRRGVRQFIRDRIKRIVLPLVMFWPICTILLGASLVLAVFIQNGGAFPTQPPADAPHASGFPLTHLWFLYILIWLYALALAFRSLFNVLDRNHVLRTSVDVLVGRVFQSYGGPVLLAVPIAVCLITIPEWIWWGGVQTPDQSLIPVWPSLFIFFYLFALGWLVDRQRFLLRTFRKNWILNLVVGLAGACGCLYLAGWKSDYLSTPDETEQLLYAVCYSLALTSLTFAFIGAGMRFFDKERPAVRYLADASYWMYIFHLPIVFFLQTAFMDVSLHWSIKFVLINLFTCIPLILSYHWMVRSTWMGAILNGRRYERALPKRGFITSTTQIRVAGETTR